MASLKDIRIRIASVKSTRKITSAMKVVSAAKFHKAQELQNRFQLYRDKFAYTLGLVMSHCDDVTHPLMKSRDASAPVAVIAFSSNSSLCGPYNQNVANEALRLLHALRAQNRTYDVYAYGKKVAEALRRNGVPLVTADEELVNKPAFEQVAMLYDRIEDAFLAGKYSEVHIVYNAFHNAAVQESTVCKLLPVEPDGIEPLREDSGMRIEYIVEPSPKQFFDFALPHFGRLSLYSYVLSNYVGEHGARMTAMSQATDNANNLVNDLTLEYNKARQAAITGEILEIVSGANALSNA